jgi:hypothetical protein
MKKRCFHEARLATGGEVTAFRSGPLCIGLQPAVPEACHRAEVLREKWPCGTVNDDEGALLLLHAWPPGPRRDVNRPTRHARP